MLTIERFLGELTNPQVAFAVQQKQPKTFYDAVACILETKSYLMRGAKNTRVAAVTVVPDCGSELLAAAPEQETHLHNGKDNGTHP